MAYRLAGKLRLREYLLDSLGLTGSDRELDVGTGRGLMAVGAARRMPGGEAVGLDAWRSGDLSGNGRALLQANAAAAGVGVKIADDGARGLPLPDAGSDAVASLLCLANIADRQGGRGGGVPVCVGTRWSACAGGLTAHR